MEGNKSYLRSFKMISKRPSARGGYGPQKSSFTFLFKKAKEGKVLSQS